jgi:hypothetical protein
MALRSFVLVTLCFCAVATVATRSTAADVTCRSLSANCSYCLEDPQCGWCNVDQVCVPGTWSGPNVGHCSQWSYDTCVVPPPPSTPSPTTAAPSPTTAAPSPTATTAVYIGSFSNLAGFPLLLWFVNTMGQVCANTPEIPPQSDFEWYSSGTPNPASNIVNVGSCSDAASNSFLMSIEVINASSLHALATVPLNDILGWPIYVVDFAYSAAALTPSGTDAGYSWGSTPSTMSSNRINNSALNAGSNALVGAGTWYSNVSTLITVSFYHEGIECLYTEMEQGPGAVFTWRLGPGYNCVGLDSATLSSETVSCGIVWPATYGWTGASLIIAESSTAPDGWCIAPNMWVVNGPTMEGVSFSGCQQCANASREDLSPLN